MPRTGRWSDCCCRILGVARQNYNKAKRSPTTPNQLRRQWLTGLIREVHIASRGTYGYRSIHAELTLGVGIQVCPRTISVLMTLAGIRGLPDPVRIISARAIIVGVAARTNWQKLMEDFEVVSPEQERVRADAEAFARVQRHSLGYLYVLPIGSEYVKIGWILDPGRITAKKSVYWSRYQWPIGVPWVSGPISHAKPEGGGYSDLIRLKDILLAYAHEHSDGQRPTFENDETGFKRVEFDLFHADFEVIRERAMHLMNHAEFHLARRGRAEGETQARRRNESFERAFGPRGRFPSTLSEEVPPVTDSMMSVRLPTRWQQLRRCLSRLPFSAARHQ